ncbi:MAG TPA: branched-chain amino acid ABC transporter permease [Quisquiliibacterium sp.]|nr:branched-chain amino acid ABC transporter permease [Quisquiliibacterium sp.]
MSAHPVVRATAYALVAALALIALPFLGVPAVVLDIISHVAILGLFATSLNVLIGQTGMVAFGHAMFYASGAYAFGLLMQTGNWSIPAALAAAVVISAAIALVVGLICTRTKEIYFAFLTLAIQMLFYSAILSAIPLTGGDQGLMGGFRKPPILGLDMSDPNVQYGFIVVVAVVVLGALWTLTQTPFGHALRMIRDNAARVDFLGMNVTAYRLAAFVIASSAASVAGVLMSLFVSGAYPNFGYWTMSGEAIFVIMLGGLHAFLGPTVGAVILTLLNHFVTEHTEHYGLVLGTVIIAYVLGLRRGLLDVLLDAWRARRGRSGAVGAARQ